MNQEIFSGVQHSIAESLAIEEEKVTLNSRLIDDLGADSLDFLDIIFSLEKQFSTKLRDPRLDLLIRADFSQPKATEDGYLSTESVNQLGEWLPEIKSAGQITARNVYSYITVETLVRLVEEKLNTP